MSETSIQTEELINEAKSKIDQAKYVEAEALLRKAEEYDPNSSEIRELLNIVSEQTPQLVVTSIGDIFKGVTGKVTIKRSGVGPANRYYKYSCGSHQQ